ncbi:MAG: hypothetical protein AAF213_02725 [Pseudomonadota bacterium]
MADEPSFSQQAITAIKERVPEITGHSLIIDGFAHDNLDNAITAALLTAEPAFAHAVKAQLDELYPEEYAIAEKHFAAGGAFSFPLDLKPGELPPVTILSPFQPLDDVYDPPTLLAGKLSWHGALGGHLTDDEVYEEASRFMRFAGWHEVGHTVAVIRGHADDFDPLPHPDDLEEWPEVIEEIAWRNADEQYADGYGLRQIASEDPDMGLVTALEVSDYRAINIVAGLIKGMQNIPIYSTDSAITAAIRDMTGYVEPGGLIKDPGSDTIAEQTHQAVLSGKIDPEDLAELKVCGDTLKDALHQSDEAFAQQLGQLGKGATGSPLYYLARNYISAMDRLLPDEHPMREPFAQAGKAVAQNPEADFWDHQNPPVFNAMIAANQKLKRLAKQPRPQPPQARRRP